MRPAIRDARGSLHVPMAIVVFSFALLAFGSWGLLRHWRALAEVQLRLDRCVGKTAQDLREIQNAIESSNSRIRELRIAIAAAAAAMNPEAIPELQAVLETVVVYQEGELARWKLEQAAWLARRGCDGRRDLPHVLASLQWHRPPPDATGPLPLAWEGAPSVRITLAHAPRVAGAQVFRQGDSHANWKAQWIPSEVNRFQ